MNIADLAAEAARKRISMRAAGAGAVKPPSSSAGVELDETMDCTDDDDDDSHQDSGVGALDSDAMPVVASRKTHSETRFDAVVKEHEMCHEEALNSAEPQSDNISEFSVSPHCCPPSSEEEEQRQTDSVMISDADENDSVDVQRQHVAQSSLTMNTPAKLVADVGTVANIIDASADSRENVWVPISAVARLLQHQNVASTAVSIPRRQQQTMHQRSDHDTNDGTTHLSAGWKRSLHSMRSQHSSDEISNDAMECRDSHTSESEQRQNNQRNNCASSLLDLLRSSASRQSKMLPSSISVQCKQYNETCGLLDRLETSFSSTNNTSPHDKQIDESEHQSANERAVRSFLSFIETRHLDLDYILARLNGCRDGIAVHPLPLCEVQKQAADITQQHTTISVSRIVRKEDTKNLDDSIEDASIAITEISTSSSYEQSSNGSEAPILSTLVSSAVAATAESQPQDRPPHNDNIPLKDDPTYSIYFRMLRYGFTMGAVRAALERDGMVDITRLDPEISVCEQLNEGEGDLNGGEVTDEDDSDGVARVPSESRLLANNPSLKRTQSTGGIPSWLKPQANRGILEGWLRKRTRRGIWVRRWYLLDSTGIYYSHSPPFSAEASGNAASSYRRSNSSSSKLIKLADARYLTIQRWSDNPLVFELRESTQSESIVALRAQSNVEVMLWEASIASFSENQRFLDEVVVSSGRIHNMVEKHRPSVEDEVDGNVEVTLDEYDYTDSALEENNNNEDETLSDPLEEPLENDNLADITNSRIESIAGNKGDETSTNAKLEEATEQQHVTTYIEQNDDGEQTIEENSPITDNRAAAEPAPRSALTTMLNKRAATSSADGKADNFVTSMANDEAVDDETQADPRTALMAMLNKRAASSDDDKAEEDDEA
eukprot:scaffold1414_cov204-Alexandrium_tamarense.AAC.1